MTIIDRRYSVAEGQAIKTPCKAATTANITLSGAQTVDGVALTETSPPTRCLVKDQSDQTLNGIYDVSTGNWTRTKDFDGAYDIVKGTAVYITDGTVSTRHTYLVTTAGTIVVGTSSITFEQDRSSEAAANAVAAAASAVSAASSASAASTSATSAATSATAAALSAASTFILPQTYHASGSGSNTTGSITSGAAILTLASAIDFANLQGIRVNHAGAAFAINQPSALLVTPTGTTGATAYAYTIASLDASGGVGRSITNATTATGNATLTATNYNHLAWSAPAGTPPAAYAIYGNKAGLLALIAIIPVGTLTFNDTGAGAITAPDWLPAAPQTAAALADWLVTTILSGAGTTTVTLAANAGTTAAAQYVIHDDTVQVQAAITAGQVAGQELFIPQGSYQLSSPLTSTSRLTIEGAGYQGDSGLNYVGGSLSYNSAANIVTGSGWKGASFVCGILRNCFDIATNDAVTLEKFQIVYPVRAMTGIIAINCNALAGAGNSNTFSTLRDLFISGSDIAISLNNWLNFTIDHCTLAPWTTSIITAVPNYPSFGDSNIVNCTMFGRNIVQHIFVTSGGGLRIENNKIVSGTIGIYILTNLIGDQIEPLIICGNSLEGQTVGIQIQQNTGSTTQATQIAITGNQLYVGSIGINIAYLSSTWVTGFTLSANTITILSTTGVCIQMDGAQIGIISANVFVNGAASGTGVVLGSHTTGINVQSNAYIGSFGATVTNVGVSNTIGGGSQ